MRIVGLKAALNSNNRYKYRTPDFVVDHLVIGGGVVGLAIARALALNYPDKTTYLVERNGSAGEETSSRNSEVIHADTLLGLYYPTGSLKESLCIRGRHLLYQYCDASSVPYRKTGKLVVATESQRPYIESLYKRIESLEWPAKTDTGYPPSGPPIPAELISGSEARDLEPDLSPDISAALLSHETGIVDSHTVMESLEKDVMESENGELVYSTSVVRVDPYRSRPASGARDVPWNEEGWVIQMVTRSTPEADSSQGDAFLAHNVVNASGLSANLILNSLLPPEKRIPMYYARGSYAAYNGPGVRRVKRLLYPCPDTGKKGKHAFQSLGTHLTLDLNGNIKFGPDLQWISPSGAPLPNPGATPVSSDGTSKEDVFSYDENDVDFWKQYLIPDDSQIAAVTKAVKQYLPGADESKFRPDYVGIRPKLVPPWGGFQDFVFRRDRSTDFLEGSGSENKRGNGEMITLLGIESPGLTASLAIAEKIIGMLEHNNDH